MSMDIAFDAHFDGMSQAWVMSFQRRFKDALPRLFADLSVEFGEAGVEFIQPQVRGNWHWQRSTGDTARGIGYEVSKSGDGFTLNFVGTNMSKGGRKPHNIAHMIDVGNFPKSSVLKASDYDMPAFPIGKRTGTTERFMGGIHGMGYTSPEYPKNFSEKGVKELHRRVPELAETPLQDFLDELVLNVI